jgi:hypothetical protein
MNKKLFLSLSILLFCFSFINGQWPGLSDKGVTITSEPNSTLTTAITVIAPLTINGDTLDISCAIRNVVALKAVDTNDGLVITICGQSKTYDYLGLKAFIKNGDGNRFTFTKVLKEDKNYDFPFKIDSTAINIYYDALVLDLGSSAQKGIIIKKYNLNQKPEIHEFLSDVKPDLALVISSESTDTPQFNVSNASGINVTKIADGFAKFIASQFKKELTISFFNKITEKINDPSTRDLGVLFKNTKAQLNLIGDRFTHYQAYLASLRQTMEYDCHQIPDRLKTILEDPNSQISDALSTNPDFQYILENVLTFGLGLRDSVHIGKALADLNLAKSVGQGVADKNLIGSFETVQLLSESLKNINTGPNDSYWITPLQMTTLVQDTSLLHLYLGLVAETSRTDSINLESGSLYNLLNKNKANEARQLVESMISIVRSVEKIIASSSNGVAESSKDIVALQYFDAATNLINSSKHLAPLLPPDDAKKLQHYNVLASSVNDMTRSFVTQKYSMGILYLSRILIQMDSSSQTLKKINSVITNQGLFIAQMAESESSDDVAAILENFAAPVGSWRDKRTAKWNVALDSYIGPAVYKINDEKARIAFSTPVGASVTIPFNHVTFFVSIADLGPLTSFRLTNDTSEIADVFLKEILSPGIFASINFGDNYPVTLNAGYQQFPLLSKVGEIENSVSVSRKGGFSGSVVVNIPLFTLYNERKD